MSFKSQRKIVVLTLVAVMFLSFIPCVLAQNTNSVAYWESTGNIFVDVGQSVEVLIVNVTAIGLPVGNTNVAVSSDSGRLDFYPLSQLAISQTTSFSVSNAGGYTQEDNVPINIVFYDSYSGSEAGNTTVYATVLQTLSTPTTTIPELTPLILLLTLAIATCSAILIKVVKQKASKKAMK